MTHEILTACGYFLDFVLFQVLHTSLDMDGVFLAFGRGGERRRTPKQVTQRRKGVHAVEHAICSQQVHPVWLPRRSTDVQCRTMVAWVSDQQLL